MALRYLVQMTLVQKFRCWWGYHTPYTIKRLDEARFLGGCHFCAAVGFLDSQGHLEVGELRRWADARLPEGQMVHGRPHDGKMEQDHE